MVQTKDQEHYDSPVHAESPSCDHSETSHELLAFPQQQVGAVRHAVKWNSKTNPQKNPTLSSENTMTFVLWFC